MKQISNLPALGIIAFLRALIANCLAGGNRTRPELTIMKAVMGILLRNCLVK